MKRILLNLQESTKKSDLIEDNDILRHNLAVFETSASGNSNKLKVFSSLLDIIPEAKQNLIIYYLRNDQINQAYNLIKELQPVTTKDYILKAVVHCVLGQQQQDQDKTMNEHLRKAQTFFQSIGSSTTECDTIEGRQCMASCFRLSNIFNDELIYLESIEQYMKDDDDFNWNYGIALASCQKYKTAEENFKKLYEPFKANIIKLHEQRPDLPKSVMAGGVKVTYVSPSTRTTIDSKKLKEEEPELAKKFTKTSNVSASVRLEEV